MCGNTMHRYECLMVVHSSGLHSLRASSGGPPLSPQAPGSCSGRRAFRAGPRNKARLGRACSAREHNILLDCGVSCRVGTCKKCDRFLSPVTPYCWAGLLRECGNLCNLGPGTGRTSAWTHRVSDGPSLCAIPKVSDTTCSRRQDHHE